MSALGTPRPHATTQIDRTDPCVGAAIADAIWSSPIGVCTFDTEARVTAWNATCKQLTGWPAADVIGQVLPLRLSAEHDEFGGVRGLVLAGESFTDLEVVQERRDGSPVDLGLTLIPLRGPGGGVRGALAILTDITERKRADRDFQKVACLVENSADFTAILTLDGDVLYLNAAGRDLVGLDAMATVLSMRAEDLLSAASRARFATDVLPRARDGRAWDGELRLWRGDDDDGAGVDVRGTVFPVPDPRTNRPMCLAASFRDITDKKRDEDALRRRDVLLGAVAAASNRLLTGKILADSVTESIGIVGRATGVERVFVWTMAADAAPADAALPCFEWLSDAPATAGGPMAASHSGRRALSRAWLDRLAAGEPVGRAAPEGAFDADDVIAGGGPEGVLLVPIRIDGGLWGVVGFDRPRDRRAWAGSEVDILMAMAANIGAAVARFQSEGDLIISNHELAKARDGAELASKAKTEFLANMSHEIRTPMTAILGYSDLLSDADASAEERDRYVDAIRRNGRHLLDLINDILDISKIEAGKMQVETVPCSVCDIVAEVSSMMRGRATEKSLAFRVDYAGPVPEQAHTDPTRVRQVLINLLGNAIKFTEAGEVVLHVTAVTGGPELRLRFSVRDTGVGLTREQIGRLFKPFTQADTSVTRRFGGTGLGLHICKRLAAMLGGDLTVDSTPGRGSTFALEIAGGPADPAAPMVLDPARRSLPAEEPRSLAAPTRRLHGRILLAEDGPDNQRLFATYLGRAGAVPDIVDNGADACERALAADAAGDPYGVILMDIQMPRMDGYTAVARLRVAGYGGTVIALTAHAMPEDRERCLSHGYTDYMTKPVKRDALVEMVGRYLAIAPLSPAAAVARATSPVPDPLVCPSPTAPAPAPRDGAQAARTPGSSAVPSPPSPGVIRSALRDDPDIGELLLDYVGSLGAVVGDLAEQVAKGDVASVLTTVHQLKGTAGNFGFLEVTDRAREAEQAMRAAADLTAVTAAVDELIGALRRVEGYAVRKERNAC